MYRKEVRILQKPYIQVLGSLKETEAGRSQQLQSKGHNGVPTAV